MFREHVIGRRVRKVWNVGGAREEQILAAGNRRLAIDANRRARDNDVETTMRIRS